MWLLLAILGAATPAAASDDDARWAKSEVRAKRAYVVGWWTGMVGTSTKIGATYLGDSGLRLAGGITQKSGVGLMLASGMRERRAIAAQGGKANGTRGRVGWAMWGLSGVLDIGGPQIAEELVALGSTEQIALGIEIAGVATTLSSYVLAVSQHRHNLLASAQRTHSHRPRIRLRPVASSRMTGGELTGQF